MGTENVVYDLFVEFADSHNAGQDPSVEDYLRRAGSHADDLRGMIRGFLAARQDLRARAAGAKQRVFDAIAQLGPSPQAQAEPLHQMLAALEEQKRLEARCTRAAIVEQIARQARVPEPLYPKFRRCYHRLKNGRIHPRGVAPRLLAAIASCFGVPLRGLLRAAAATLPAEGVPAAQFTRLEGPTAPAEPPHTQASAPTEPDAVDRMFFGDEPDAD